MAGPTYLAYTPAQGGGDGIVAAAQGSANTVAILKADGTPVKTLKASANVTLARPMGVAFTQDGGLLVADAGNRRVVRFTARDVAIYGDVDGNGAFNGNDAVIALRIGAGLALPDAAQFSRADVVTNSKVDARDAVTLARRLRGL